MQHGQKTVIFDTSAINRLANDADGRIIAKAIGAVHHLRITATSIAESAADPGTDHRRQLFEVFKLLLSNGQCTIPFQWIIERLAKTYFKRPENFEWNSIVIRFLDAERPLHEDVFHDHAESERIRHEDKAWAEEFEQIYKNERPPFDDIFAGSNDKLRPSFKEFCKVALRKDGHGWSIIEGLFEKSTGSKTNFEAMADFANKCPPVRAALMWAHYKKCIAGRRSTSIGRAGRQDLMSSVYLPYCNIFVTNDSGQKNALLEIKDEARLAPQVMAFEDFIKPYQPIFVKNES